MKTKEEKLEIINNAIDAIMNLTDVNDSAIDYHYFIHSENSVVMKLRRIYTSIEENE